jgi:hypothetical protein
MNRKFFIAAVSIGMLAFTPNVASALTLIEMQNEVAGMNCSGSTCTSTTYGTRTEPTTIETEVLVQKGKSHEHKLVIQDHCGFWGKFGNLNADCVPYSLSSTSSADVTKIVVTPGPDRVIDTETVVTKTIGYHPDASARDKLWSVDTVVVTRDRN